MGQKVPQPKTPKEHIDNARAELKQFFTHKEELELGAAKEGRVLSSNSLVAKLSQRSQLGYYLQDNIRVFILHRAELLGLDTSVKATEYINRVREPMAMAMLDEMEKGFQ